MAVGGLDTSYSKAHIDSFANLFIELPSSDAVGAKIVNVRGYSGAYISNIHTVSCILRTTIKDRATFYAGYNIVRDTGDGRAAQDLGLTNPASAFLAMAQTFPMTYQAPMARLSIRMTPKLQWNGGWGVLPVRPEIRVLRLPTLLPREQPAIRASRSRFDRRLPEIGSWRTGCFRYESECRYY